MRGYLVTELRPIMGFLNGNNFGGGCGGNGEFIERWPLAGTSPSYEGEVSLLRVVCQEQRSH